VYMDRERRRLVHRYIDGLASLPERREVERYIATDPEVAAYVRRHATVWAHLGAMPDSIADPDSAAAMQELAAKIRDADSTRALPVTPRADLHAPLPRVSGPVQVVTTAPKPLRVRRTFDWSTVVTFGATAAAVTLIVLGSRDARLGGGGTHTGSVKPASSDLNPPRSLGAGESPVSFTAQVGTRRSFTLPDGSDITLGPASHLSYVPNPGGYRTVSLAGEALFHVAHNPDRPFIVRVAGATIQDLGTVFTVRAYSASPTRVSVQAGQVAVRSTYPGAAGPATVLVAGTSTTVDSPTPPAVITDPTVVSEAFAWTHGSLHYHSAPLTEIAADLGRAYDLDIQIPDPDLRQLVVQFSVEGESARAALDVLMATLATVRYEQHGRVVTLYRR
jgi:ferric-dicitrate binding protein FerR (iron transport regulator)